MKNQKLPPGDHVIRYVPFGKLRKDENDVPIGILGAAFKLRDGEEYLSTTWLEYFAGSKGQQITAAVQAIRASQVDVRPKSGFAIGRVDAIAATCAERGHSIRIIHEPEDDNKAHAAVRRMPRDDDQLLELLAAESWCELILNTAVAAGAYPAPNKQAC
jgi:hypothetical protein